MLGRFTVKSFFWLGLVLGTAGGCSPEQHKQDADKEVYQIIDEKWQDHFPSRANYTISDVPPSPNDVQIPEYRPDHAITLTEAVALATAQNRTYQTQKENLYLQALNLTLARHEFNPQFFGILGGSYNRNAADESVSADSRFGFNQLLAEGTNISVSIANDWMRFLTGDPRQSLGSLLTASFAQPLLRGSRREIVQENLTQAERDTLYELRSFNRFRKTFVVGIINDYYSVLEALDQVENANNNYQRLSIAYEQLKMLGEAGRQKSFEVDQAEQSKLSAWDNYVSTQESYKQVLDQFKIKLALPTDAQVVLDPNEMRALERQDISDPNYPLDEAMELALQERLDLANNRDQVADAERKVMVAEDNLAAALELVGSANVDSTPPSRMGRMRFHEGDYSLGLDMDLPLERKAERNAYRTALITLSRQQRAYELAIDEVKLTVRQSYRDLREAASRHKIQQLSLDLALKRVESTKMLLDAGRSTTRDMLESERALLDAQNARTSALVTYTIAKLRFFLNIEILQVQPDGMWSIENYGK